MCSIFLYAIKLENTIANTANNIPNNINKTDIAASGSFNFIVIELSISDSGDDSTDNFMFGIDISGFIKI